MQDGTCCSSFLMFIGELEREGILTLQHGNVPPRLKGAAALVSMRSLATLGFERGGMPARPGRAPPCGGAEGCSGHEVRALRLLRDRPLWVDGA